MAHPFTYVDGLAVLDGDRVLTERGTSRGTVVEVVTAESPENRGMQGRGVVVDADRGGLVFLSETFLAEDPLQFVSRGPGASTRFHAGVALVAGGVLLIPALISLCSAIYSALASGQVMVISLSRWETRTEYVSWNAGWARFVGPIVLLYSLWLYVGARALSSKWWVAASGCTVGLVLLFYSLWFSSARGTLWFMALVAFVASTLYIGKKFGRPAAFGVILVVMVVTLWKAAGAI